MVNHLIANGANVNAIESTGAAPLHVTAHFGITEIAKILIANGANVNAVIINGTTPLMQAEWSGAKDLTPYSHSVRSHYVFISLNKSG